MFTLRFSRQDDPRKKTWNKKSRDIVPFKYIKKLQRWKMWPVFRTMWRSSCRRTSSRALAPPPALRASPCSGSYSPVSRSESTTKIFFIRCFLKEFVEKAVFRIHMFLGLPDSDPLVGGMDPDPDPSIIKKTLIPTVLLLLFDFLLLTNNVNVP